MSFARIRIAFSKLGKLSSGTEKPSHTKDKSGVPPPPPAILSSHQARNASPRVLLTRPVTLDPFSARGRHPHALARGLPVEADVNVLVVGGSAARRGAIGRHFPLPLIRRSPAKAAVTAQRRTRPATRRCQPGGKRGVHTTGQGGRAHSPFSLLIWRVQARRTNGPGAPGAAARLHQHGGHTRSPPPTVPPPPGVPKRVGRLCLREGRPSKGKMAGVFATNE